MFTDAGVHSVAVVERLYLTIDAAADFSGRLQSRLTGIVKAQQNRKSYCSQNFERWTKNGAKMGQMERGVS